MKITAGFLQDEGARGIIAALGAAGEEARFVGGCVRDALAVPDHLPGIPEIDLATTALPEKTLQVLELAGFSVKPVGLAHGVVLAVRDGRHYEIATLREDVETDGRHAIVAYTRDWALDARRRDFTMNALSADLEGNVYDYCDGLADITARHVRFIGEAGARIREDYLRILRFYRFNARFAGAAGRFDGEWDAAARAACRDGRAGLVQLSRERVTEELSKLLLMKNPLEVCRVMTADLTSSDCHPRGREAQPGDPRLNNPNVSESETQGMPNCGSPAPACGGPRDDTSFIDGLVFIDDLEQLITREKIYGQQPWHLRLAAWGGLVRGANEKFLQNFVFTRLGLAEIRKFATLDYSRIHHALYHHGVGLVRGAVLLRAADSELPELMRQIENFTPHEFPLQAEDLLAMGVQPGPRLGEILREVENWWLSGDYAADRAACKNYAAMLATVSKT